MDNEERSARFSAVFGIFGFVDVPIVYMSIRLWRDIHPSPVVAGGGSSGLHPDIRITFFFSLFVFTLLFIFMLVQRLRLEKSVIAIADLKREASLSA